MVGESRINECQLTVTGPNLLEPQENLDVER